jgi:hypothetical protein
VGGGGVWRMRAPQQRAAASDIAGHPSVCKRACVSVRLACCTTTCAAARAVGAEVAEPAPFASQCQGPVRLVRWHHHAQPIECAGARGEAAAVCVFVVA